MACDAKMFKEATLLNMNEPTNRPCGDGMGTLPSCAPLAVPYVPFQQNGSQTYSQQDALANGTLFPGLNLPFQINTVAATPAQPPATSSSWPRRADAVTRPCMGRSPSRRLPVRISTPGSMTPGPGSIARKEECADVCL